MDMNVDHPAIVQVTGRFGYSRYYTYGFLTGGAEAAVKLPLGGLQAVAGVEVYSVNRRPPPDVALELGIYSEWQQVVPVNLGVLYGFQISRLEPYVGADLVMAPVLKDDDGQHFAFGGRARAGLDVMIVPHLGVNANLAAGAWSGGEWDQIDETLGNGGPVVQLSGGVFVGF
ncbi:MAG: hypothetical protein R3F59_05605 [Myxococcota bacterium]